MRPIALRKLAWLAVWLFSVEIILWGVGLLFLPAPPVVVILMGFAAWALIAHSLIVNKIELPSWIPNYLSSRPLILALLLALTLSLTIGPLVHHGLWMSGNFGEPPFNRMARLCSDKGLLEFSVLATPVERFDVIVEFKPGSDWKRVKAFLAPPGYKGIPPTNERVSYKGVSTRGTPEEHQYRTQGFTGAISRELSLYVVFPTEFLPIRGCSFDTLAELEPNSCEFQIPLERECIDEEP